MRLFDISALPPILPWSPKSGDGSKRQKRDDERPHDESHVDLVEERRAGPAEHHAVDIRI